MLVFSCLFMWPYFCASVDGRLTDRRQRVGGGRWGAAREGQALWPGLRLTGSEAVKVFASLMFRSFFF